MKHPKTVFMEMFSDTNTFASKLVSGRLTRKNMWSYFLDKSHKKDRSQQKSLFIKQKECKTNKIQFSHLRRDTFGAYKISNEFSVG